ncbi:hypothetical protein [Rubrivirga sp. IMCC45206]|uniref:hypothetical protein n=1 Tax=Rubrivirga sp. IMCC45206 TaxID=3391614 RepID=UPI00398FF817
MRLARPWAVPIPFAMRRLSLLAVLLLVAGCDSSVGPPEAVELVAGEADATLIGTMELIETEEPGWVILEEGGRLYGPTNVPRAYKVSGLAVRAEVDLLDEQVDRNVPFGRPVRIRRIAPR